MSMTNRKYFMAFNDTIQIIFERRTAVMKINLDIGKAGLGLFGAGLAILAGIVEDKKMEYTVEKEVKKQLSGGDESEEKKK